MPSNYGNICVFVSSSDRTKDIFEIVFRDSQRIWSDCSWPRYVGFTTASDGQFGYTAVSAHRESTWREELSEQIEQLPQSIDYILLLLDDYSFATKVDAEVLYRVFQNAQSNSLSYVRLVPVLRNPVGYIVELFRRRFDASNFRKLSPSEPYYSSLQAAIWRRDHLQSFLSRPGSIWDFEHIVSDDPHYAVWEKVLNYQHVVERGKWLRCAHTLVGQELDFKKRPQHGLAYAMKRWKTQVVFLLVGYLNLRVRRYLKKRRRVAI